MSIFRNYTGKIVVSNTNKPIECLNCPCENTNNPDPSVYCVKKEFYSGAGCSGSVLQTLEHQCMCMNQYCLGDWDKVAFCDGTVKYTYEGGPHALFCPDNCNVQPAPCTCPCTTYPPPSWPCNGINQTYTIDNGMTSSYGGIPIFAHTETYYMNSTCSGAPDYADEWRLGSPIVVSDVGLASCYWENSSLGYYYRYFDGSAWSGWSLYSGMQIAMGISTDPWCRWIVATTNNIGAAYKSTGQNPIGAYYDTVCIDLGGYSTRQTNGYVVA